MKNAYRPIMGAFAAVYLAACGGNECREGRVDLGGQELQHGASAEYFICREDVQSTIVDENGKRFDSIEDFQEARAAKMQKEVSEGTSQLRDQKLDLTLPAEPCPEKKAKKGKD